MATVQQVNTWLKLIPGNMQTTLSAKLSGSFLPIPTAKGNESAAYVIRNFIAQTYGIDNAAAIYADPLTWEGGRFISEFQTAVINAYTVPFVYRDVNDSEGVALEEFLVQTGVLTSSQTLADTSHITPYAPLFFNDGNFLAVGTTDVLDESDEATEAGSNTDYNKEKEIDLTKDALQPDAGQYLQGDFLNQLIAGHDMSAPIFPTTDNGVECAMLNQQSSLLIQSLATVSSFDAVGMANRPYDDERQAHIFVSTPL